MSIGCIHEWKQEYYGIRCTKCDLFYPDNGNWFAPVDGNYGYPDNDDWDNLWDEDDDDFAETELSNDELEDELE